MAVASVEHVVFMKSEVAAVRRERYGQGKIPSVPDFFVFSKLRYYSLRLNYLEY